MPKMHSKIVFRYRTEDSNTGVTRETVKQLSTILGLNESQIIHKALREFSFKYLPKYEPDDGPLSDDQIKQIQKLAPRAKYASVDSSLFDSPSSD